MLNGGEVQRDKTQDMVMKVEGSVREKRYKQKRQEDRDGEFGVVSHQ